MAEVRLYDSMICRLCAEDNESGEMLFTDDAEETEWSAMVNRYLPLKIQDDGKLPRTICPGCKIQLEGTVQFFELLLNGQRKIREMWQQQVEFEKKIGNEYFKQSNICLALKNSELNNEHFSTDTKDPEIIFKITPDGFVYDNEHELSAQMQGLDKYKRKKGRPPKCFSEDESKEIEKDILNAGTGQEEDEEEEEDKQDEELNGDKRKRRKRKVPKRYMETVQGKELDNIFKEDEVFEENSVSVKYEPTENQNNSSIDSCNSDTEIIGHLETEEGKNLGEVVIINKNRNRSNQKQKSSVKRKSKFTCSFCDKGFMQRSKYIIHKSLHKIIKYECAECQNIFSNKEDLKLHQTTTVHAGENIIKVHEEIKPLENHNSVLENDDLKLENIVDVAAVNCIPHNIKSSNATESNELNNMIKTQEITETNPQESIQEFNEIDDTFKCGKCNKHFQTKNNLDTHVKVVHQGEKPFICELCNKAFAYQSSLQGHKEIAHQNKTDKGFPCDVCGKVLNHPSSVIYHKSTEHNGRRFVCNKCGKIFKHKQLLQRHQIVHSEDRPYPCDNCNSSFKTKANLLNHQSTHTGEKKHCCELCNTKFAHKTSLTLHYRTHTGQKPYKCEVCSKSFSQNGNLQEHMRIHTGEKPYCCDHCGRKFTTSSQFKLHVKRHTGERPWKCDTCSKSFLHKDTWKCHVRRHTGERPFQCSYCSRCFTEQWALKKHLRLHTGEKPYSCEICGKAFADCSNLTKHKKVHKNQQLREFSDLAKNGNSSDVGNEELWQILPNAQGNRSIINKMNEVINPSDISEDASRIIYVAYDDTNQINESTALQIDKETLINDDLQNIHEEENNDDSSNIDFSDLQLTITDVDGNPISLSVQQARQLLSDGQLLNQINNGHIQVQNVSSAKESNMEIAVQSSKANSISKTSEASTLPTDAEAIVKILQDESTDATAVAAMSQLNAEEQLQMTDNQNFIELIGPNGEKIRLINVDQLQLSSGYLTIV